MKKKTNDELVFLPLGGSGEIGMNLNLYGYGPEANREWIVVDVGVTFGDLSTPGVDVIVPDPAFLEGETIRGIVLTHAHEDHIGALGWLWSRMKAPLYATPFTAFLIREKFGHPRSGQADRGAAGRDHRPGPVPGDHGYHDPFDRRAERPGHQDPAGHGASHR
jgi:mRNA degradation ribonuclease J1/J2